MHCMIPLSSYRRISSVQLYFAVTLQIQFSVTRRYIFISKCNTQKIYKSLNNYKQNKKLLDFMQLVCNYNEKLDTSISRAKYFQYSSINLYLKQCSNLCSKYLIMKER